MVNKWNPVKELKDTVVSWQIFVLNSLWNPVKELKAEIAENKKRNEEEWNPVKELKGVTLP